MSPNPGPPPGYTDRYPYAITEPPGVNVRRLRAERGLSLRGLAAQCKPPSDAAAIQRLEHNQYTQTVLEKVAGGLQVPVWVLFVPSELADYQRLSAPAQQRVVELIRDVAISDRYRRSS